MNLHELKALEASVPPGEWKVENDYIVFGNGKSLDCEGQVSQEHQDLMVAARNALPTLIRIAEAAFAVIDNYQQCNGMHVHVDVDVMDRLHTSFGDIEE